MSLIWDANITWQDMHISSRPHCWRTAQPYCQSLRRLVSGTWLSSYTFSHSYLRTGDSIGLKAIAETIDNRNDFKTFMQNFTVARGSQRGPSRNVPYDDGSVCRRSKLPNETHSDTSVLFSSVTGDASACSRFSLWKVPTATTATS